MQRVTIRLLKMGGAWERVIVQISPTLSVYLPPFIYSCLISALSLLCSLKGKLIPSPCFCSVNRCCQRHFSLHIYTSVHPFCSHRGFLLLFLSLLFEFGLDFGGNLHYLYTAFFWSLVSNFRHSTSVPLISLYLVSFSSIFLTLINTKKCPVIPPLPCPSFCVYGCIFSVSPPRAWGSSFVTE